MLPKDETAHGDPLEIDGVFLAGRHLEILRVLEDHEKYPMRARTIKRYVAGAGSNESVDASDLAHEMRHLAESGLVEVDRGSNRNFYSIADGGKRVLERVENKGNTFILSK